MSEVVNEWNNLLNFYQYGLGGLIERGAFENKGADDE